MKTFPAGLIVLVAYQERKVTLSSVQIDESLASSCDGWAMREGFVRSEPHFNASVRARAAEEVGRS